MMQARRRLHCGQANQLQQMVLHHVAQRADAIIEINTATNAELLGNRDLHMINSATPPQWFKKRVCEAQCEQVLDGLFAQVVIDAIDLVLSETSTDLVVYFGRRRKISPQRFLENDAAVGRYQAIHFEACCNRSKQARRCREIGDTNALFVATEKFIERFPLVVGQCVSFDILYAFTKCLPEIGIELSAIEIVLQRLFDQAEIIVTRQRAATDRDDAAVAGYLTVTIAVIQRRQQLAQRKVTGAAENNKVKNTDRYELSHSKILMISESLLHF